MHFDDVLNFWFNELTPKDWWKKDIKLDQMIEKRFGLIHQECVACELFSWRKKPQGRLAEIIILDQFSRNIFRNTPRAFAYDPLALVLSQEAVYLGEDKKLPENMRGFLYMPFMHSESKLIHTKALELFTQKGLEQNLEAEIKHKKIIDRFGRYPHRNEILNRKSTPAELEFLLEPGSSF